MSTSPNFDFDADFASAVGAFSEILGLESVPITASQFGTVGRALRRLRRFWHSGFEMEVHIELGRLRLFAKNLRELQEKDTPTFKTLRRRLRHGTTADYYGVHQEAMIGARLVRTSNPFVHDCDGAPDFTLPRCDRAGIECTSIHFRKKPVSENPTYKIASAIRSKGGKSYATPRVAVAIGATDVYGFGGFNFAHRTVARRALAETQLGAVLLFVEMMDLGFNPARVCQNYARVDAPAMSDGLRDILDQLWPLGKHVVADYVVPHGP